MYNWIALHDLGKQRHSELLKQAATARLLDEARASMSQARQASLRGEATDAVQPPARRRRRSPVARLFSAISAAFLRS